jgi:uncharacterized membrane protein YccC
MNHNSKTRKKNYILLGCDTMRILQYIGLAFTLFFGIMVASKDLTRYGPSGAIGGFIGVAIMGYVATWLLCHGWDYLNLVSVWDSLKKFLSSG